MQFKLLLKIIFAVLLTSISSMSAAQTLTVKYAAQDYKGAPKFRVSGYTNSSNRAVWNSQVITAVGGVDTERFGGNRSRLKWQDVSLQVKPGLDIDYFRISFINDHCCGPNRGGEKFGDRNLFIRSITFADKRYWATSGKQKTCTTGQSKPGEMYCAGTLDIKVKRVAKSSGNVLAGVGGSTTNTSNAAQLCGLSVSGVVLNGDVLRKIQSGLQSIGAYKGAIDGIMGSGSCGALRTFMAKQPTPNSFDNGDFKTLVAARTQDSNMAQGVRSRFKSDRIYVNTNDGRFWDRPQNNWIGVDAHFVNASLDGKKTKSNDWLIEITGSYRPEKIDGFLFNSYDIFEQPIPATIATSTNSATRGPQYFFGDSMRNASRDKAFFKSLRANDLHTAEAACVALSDTNNVRSALEKAAASNKFDRQHANFWKNASHISSIQRIAQRCVQTISEIKTGSGNQRKNGLTFSDYELRPVDGRAEGRNIIGSWVTLKNVRLDGEPFVKDKIWFEFLGTFDNKRVDMIGFSSEQTFTDMPTYIGEKFGNPRLGYGFATRNNAQAQTRARYNELNDTDKMIMKAICGLMSDERFVSDIVDQLANQRPFGFRDYVDESFMTFWKTGSKTKDILDTAQACNAALLNSSGAQIAFTSVRAGAVKTASAQTTKSTSICKNNSAIIRSNQSVLQDLGLYTSTIDGVAGPNYNAAVIEAEKILGVRADNAIGCLNPPERQVLTAVNDARKKGAICRNLLTKDEVKLTFEQLKQAELTKKYSLGHQNIGGLIWMIDAISDLEMRLSFDGFYKTNQTSLQDCRLDRDEFAALMPKEPQDVEISAEKLLWSAAAVDQGSVLSLTVGGRDLETTKMSKSIFGLENQVGLDVKFTTVQGAPALDFVISEEKTKINLHLFDTAVVNRNFEAQLPGLYLDEQPDGWSAFFIRMFDDGTSNIKRGEFAKILDHMPTVDKAMISALCGEMTTMAALGPNMETRLGTAQERAVFRSSPFSNPQVQRAIGDLAKECVSEIRTKGLVEATFKVDIVDIVCPTDAQKRQLEELDADIGDRRERLAGIADQITDLQVKRPLFDVSQCNAYAAQATQTRDTLNIMAQQVKSDQAALNEVEINIDRATQMLVQLGGLQQASELCLPENSELRKGVTDLIISNTPLSVGVQCADDQQAIKSPVQVVIDEINLTIIELLKLHISQDEIAEVTSEIAQQKNVLSDIAARLAQVTQAKASPDEIAQQLQTNVGLRETVDDVQMQIEALETEILGLRQVMDNNTNLIEQIDVLNQRLVQLTSDKTARQVALDDIQGQVLQAQARITQRQLETEKIMSQMADISVQMGAASSTVGNLQAEVETLAREIAQTQERVSVLDADVSQTKNLIDNANAVIAEKSQQASTLDAELNTKVAQSTMLDGSIAKLAPQADASEQTVTDMLAALDRDYVPLAQFKEQEVRLNELTQIVTERTKLIRELRADLEAIEGEEQLLIRMCLADAQCKAAMGERLGVEK